MSNRDDELREELRSHLQMAVADRIARGQSSPDAETAARRELGNASQIQEATRDVWGRRWLERVAQDVRYALRVFKHNPGFAAVAIISLALGIGANTALFELVDALRLQTLPVVDPARLVEVRLADADGARGNFNSWHISVTNPIWEAIRERQEALSGVFAWGATGFDLSNSAGTRAASETAPHSADGLWVSGGFFDVLGIRPAAGRLLTPDDDKPGCEPRAVLSYAFWQRAYAASPAAVGQTIALSGHPVVIVGVAARGFSGLEVGRSFDVALPICSEPQLDDYDKGRLASGTDWWLSVFGRLKPGWSVERATAHFAAISPELFRATLSPDYPQVSVPKYLAFRLLAEPASTGISQLREQYEAPLWILLATTGLVLLIACANLANLLLARATARQREIAIRLGVGASRGRIVRQLMTESLVLATLGGVAGAFVAGWVGRACVSLLDAGGSVTELSLRLDWRVLAFTVGLSILTCLLFGLVPAFSATRRASGIAMHMTTRASTPGRESAALRRALVIAQIALSIVLLFGSLLFTRSLRNVLAIDPGFRPSGLVSAEIAFTRLQLPPADNAMYRKSLLERVSGVPGVERAGFVNVVPMSGFQTSNTVWAEANPSRRFMSLLNTVGPGYLATAGIPLVAGRDFNVGDTSTSSSVAIVNEAFVAALGRGPQVVGLRFTRESTPRTRERTFEIVGVMRNSKYVDLKEKDKPVVFLADAQMGQPPYVRIVIRSAVPPPALTPAITRTLRQVDPRLVVDYQVLSEEIDDSLVRDRMLATLSGWFGILAGVLTLAGLYGLMAYTVARRTNEIGIRMALGARHRSIVRLVLGEVGMLVSVGAVTGALLADAAGRSAASLVFGVKPSDPVTLAAAIALLAAIALVASYLPARRAIRVAPVTALRAE
jgi:putative ABC transport system permease protein